MPFHHNIDPQSELLDREESPNITVTMDSAIGKASGGDAEDSLPDREHDTEVKGSSVQHVKEESLLNIDNSVVMDETQGPVGSPKTVPTNPSTSGGFVGNKTLVKHTSLSTLPSQENSSLLPPIEGGHFNRLRRSSSDLSASQHRRQSYWTVLKDKMDSHPDDQSKWALVMRMRDTMTNRFTARFQKWWDSEIIKKREAELRKKSVQLCLADKIQHGRLQVKHFPGLTNKISKVELTRLLINC